MSKAKTDNNGNDCDYTLNDTEAAKFLGRPAPMDCNLGHRVPFDDLTKNPVRVNGIRQERAGLVAGRATKSTGTPTPQNLDMWANYAKQNSYLGKSQKPK